MSRYCPKCAKAKKACICSWIKEIDTKVELIILQHPTEVRRAKGSAKILSLSLANSRCYVGEDFSRHEALNRLLAETDIPTFLLYPAQGARVLDSSLAPKGSGRVRIILLDGTWKKAYKMYQLSANLHTIPAICLPQELVGNYKIRKAPDSNSLSTVEAGYQALAIIDPETDFSPLIEAFDAMIEFYIQQMPPGVYEQNYKPR